MPVDVSRQSIISIEQGRYTLSLILALKMADIAIKMKVGYFGAKPIESTLRVS